MKRNARIFGAKIYAKLCPLGEQLEAGLEVGMPCAHAEKALSIEIFDNCLVAMAKAT